MKNNDFSYSSFSYCVVTRKTICRQDQKVGMLLFSIIYNNTYWKMYTKKNVMLFTQCNKIIIIL